MLSKVAREDENFLPEKKAKSGLWYAAEDMVTKNLCERYLFIIFIFKTQGHPLMISP